PTSAIFRRSADPAERGVGRRAGQTASAHVTRAIPGRFDRRISGHGSSPVLDPFTNLSEHRSVRFSDRRSQTSDIWVSRCGRFYLFGGGKSGKSHLQPWKKLAVGSEAGGG